ncbi:MAG: hypothetical protein HKN87_18540 [Saprospiraceae bacterium]|nr:hypothetical protein [Saprospiraceae bacterium]
MRNYITFIVILILTLPALLAQETGSKSFPSLGIAFTIPNGWVGQETESGYLMGSHTVPGLLMVLPHQTQTLDQLKQEAEQGLVDNEGTSLILDGSVTEFGNAGLQAAFTGTLGGQSAKAFVTSLLNKGGTGVTIMAATAPNEFTDAHKTLVGQLAQTVQFSEVVKPKADGEWSEKLKNARLTYMNSYYSSGASYGGYSTGGGYSDKEVIDLCAQGYFLHSSTSSMSFDTGGGFGSSHDGSKGAGSWTVINNSDHQPVLQLTFHNGDIHEYVITTEGSKTFLNGARYYRTYGTYADDGPDCF